MSVDSRPDITCPLICIRLGIGLLRESAALHRDFREVFDRYLQARLVNSSANYSKLLDTRLGYLLTNSASCNDGGRI